MVTAREESVTANGLRHHVLIWGDQPVDVVLCHGFLDIAWSFDALGRELVDAGHGVAAFDWRGHGESDWLGSGGYYHFPDYVLDLDDLLPQLAERPVHLLGHSMGGGACAMYAAARPERLRTLTLVEGIGPREMQPRDPATRIRAWLDGVARARNKTRSVLEDHAAALKRMRVQNPELTDELGLFLADKSTTELDGGLSWTFDPLHKTLSPRPFHVAEFHQVLASLQMPTLVVAGDRGMRLDDEQERVDKIQNHRFIEIADVGHMIHWFAPERLGRVLAAFYRDHSA